jgi:hypothetical protein
MSNLLERLDQRQMPTEDVRICLNLNLIRERDRAMGALAAAYSAQKSDQRMVGDSPDVAGARAAVTDVEERIREKSIVLRITGVDRGRYNRFMLECPPKKGTAGSFDPSKFFMHVAKNTAQYVDERGEVHAISPEEWAAIDKQITDGEHDRIAKAVIAVNREAGGSDIGFLSDDSAPTTDSFGISVSRES